MGNRALLRALANLQRDPQPPTNLAQAVLTAPDVDRDVFVQLVRAVASIAARTTLYASSQDRALRASHTVHDGPRAGEGGEGLLLVPGVDSVDVSALATDFLGHSYYGDNRSVIADLFELLHTARPPNERFCLSPHWRRTQQYWVFDRCSPH
jgi:esterase/lipase superfamily enzyme